MLTVLFEFFTIYENTPENCESEWLVWVIFQLIANNKPKKKAKRLYKEFNLNP